MGYTGGAREHPSYRSLGDHTESLRVVFDPEVISYEDLLGIYWRAHDPTAEPWSRQYASILFVHDEDQRDRAEQSRAAEAQRRGERVYTEIRPAGTFWPAEDYHQKYRLKSQPELLRAVQSLYPTEQELVSSTLAARVNGCLAGYTVSAAELEGLPASARERLSQRCATESASASCGMP